MRGDFVLDTYAIVALLRGEAGRERVREVLDGADRGDWTVHASVINLGEVVYTVERDAGPRGAQEFLAVLDQWPITIGDASWKRVLAAAHIKALHPMSYADAFAVALAQEFEAPVLTGDPEFRAVEHLVQVEWIAPPKKLAP